MPNDVQILSLREHPERAEDCRKLLLEHFNEFTSKHPSQVLESSNIFPQGYFMLKGNRVIGWTGLHEKEVVVGRVYGWEGTPVQDEVLSENLSPWITPLLVHPGERGKRYGRMLLEYARKEAGRLGFKVVYLTTDHIGYYEKNGFREVGLTMFTWGRPTKIYEHDTINLGRDKHMSYSDLFKMYEDEKYLVNMVSAEDIVRFGYRVGLNENSRVLDLCCGYGTMLKIWREVFGIVGIGVDRDMTFIETGRSRLPDDCINLICGDVLQYIDNEKYDVVVCTELSTGLFDGFAEGITFLERFLKPSGTLVFGRLFSEIPNPPQELIDFDGQMLALNEIYAEVRQCGYLITSMASGDTASWERYIMRDSKLSLEKLRNNPNDAKWVAWTEKWHRMYYDFRRPYEGWGLFGIEKV